VQRLFHDPFFDARRGRLGTQSHWEHRGHIQALGSDKVHAIAYYMLEVYQLSPNSARQLDNPEQNIHEAALHYWHVWFDSDDLVQKWSGMKGHTQTMCRKLYRLLFVQLIRFSLAVGDIVVCQTEL
jgi:hypothetical protein